MNNVYWFMVAAVLGYAFGFMSAGLLFVWYEGQKDVDEEPSAMEKNCGRSD